MPGIPRAIRPYTNVSLTCLQSAQLSAGTASPPGEFFSRSTTFEEEHHAFITLGRHRIGAGARRLRPELAVRLRAFDVDDVVRLDHDRSTPARARAERHFASGSRSDGRQPSGSLHRDGNRGPDR